MNSDIAQAAARHPEMSVVDWNARAVSHPCMQPRRRPPHRRGGAGVGDPEHEPVGPRGRRNRPRRHDRQARSRSALGRVRVGRLRRAASLRAAGGKPPYRWTVAQASPPRGSVALARGQVTGVASRAGCPVRRPRRRPRRRGADEAARSVRRSLTVPSGDDVGSCGTPRPATHEPRNASLNVSAGNVTRYCTPRPWAFTPRSGRPLGRSCSGRARVRNGEFRRRRHHRGDRHDRRAGSAVLRQPRHRVLRAVRGGVATKTEVATPRALRVPCRGRRGPGRRRDQPAQP